MNNEKGASKMKKVITTVGLVIAASALALTGLVMSTHVINSSAPPGTNEHISTVNSTVFPSAPKPSSTSIYATEQAFVAHGNPCENNNWGTVNNCSSYGLMLTHSEANLFFFYIGLGGGPATVAGFCRQVTGSSNNVFYGDCYWLLAYDDPWSWNVWKWFTAQGYDVVFTWKANPYDGGLPNIFTGYYTLPA
jgi:hypothetical protein